MEKQNREKLVAGIKKAAYTIKIIMVIFGSIGLAVGVWKTFSAFHVDNEAELLASLSILITSIIMLIISTPIENLILGFAQLVENSNIRTYKD